MEKALWDIWYHHCVTFVTSSVVLLKIKEDKYKNMYQRHFLNITLFSEKGNDAEVKKKKKDWKIHIDCETRCCTRRWSIILLQTTPAVCSNSTMQHMYHLSVQFITVYLSPWKGQQCKLSSPQTRWGACVKFLYLTDPFHAAIDRRTAGGRE